MSKDPRQALETVYRRHVAGQLIDADSDRYPVTAGRLHCPTCAVLEPALGERRVTEIAKEVTREKFERKAKGMDR